MTTVPLSSGVNILVVLGLTLPDISDAQVQMITDAAPAGSTVTVVPSVREAIAKAAELRVDVILGVITEKLFAVTPNLRWLHGTASGVDSFLFPAFRDSEVALTGEKGLVGGHLADTGFGLLLALTRQIKTAFRLGPDGWNHREEMRMKEVELEGLTMGVIGFGGTGRGMAQRAVAFGMKVLATDPYPGPADHGVEEVWPSSRLHDLLAVSDVVAVCCPLAPETRNLLDDKAFAAMKTGAIVLNVTRGEVIDGDALVAALRSGHLGGAALDVAPLEPLPAEHPLWGFDNVAMTPHTAGASQHRARRGIERFCRNLAHAQANEPFEGAIDKQLGF